MGVASSPSPSPSPSRAPAPHRHTQTRKRGSPQRQRRRPCTCRSPGRPSRRQSSVAAAAASAGGPWRGTGGDRRRRRWQRCLVASPVARRGRARHHRRGARARRRRREAELGAAAADAGRARARPAASDDAPDRDGGSGSGAAASVPRRAAAAVGQVGGGDPGPGEGGARVARHLRHRRGGRARLRRRRAPIQGRQGQAQLPRRRTPCRVPAPWPAAGRHGFDGGGADAASADGDASRHRPADRSCWCRSATGVPGPQPVRAHPAERRRPGPTGHRRRWRHDAWAVLDDHGVGILLVSGSAVGGLLVVMARSYLTRSIQIL